MSRVVEEYKLGTTASGLLACEGTQDVVTRLMRIAGSRINYPESGRPWLSVPADRVSVLALEAIAKPTSVSKEYIEVRSAIMAPTSAESAAWAAVAPRMKPGRQLLEHQGHFCAWSLGKRGVINASEQGTGKSIMSVAMIGAARKAKRIRRVLIASPKSPLRQWEDEFYDSLADQDDCPLFIPLDEGRVDLRARTLRELSRTDEYVAIGVNYEVMQAMRAELIRFRFDICVFDESWKLKSHRAQVTKAAQAVADSATESVYLLNGTPYSENVGDIWSQLSVAAGRGMAGDYSDWMRDYAESREINVGTRRITKYIGVKDQVSLAARLSPFYWRATKESCTDLPEKMKPVRVYAIMPPSADKMYARIKKDGEAAIAPEIEEAISEASALAALDEDAPEAAVPQDQATNMILSGALTTALRLQQITSGFLPPALTYGVSWTPAADDGMEWDDECGVWRIASGKPEQLRQWIEDMLLNDPASRGIVWCKFNADIATAYREAVKVLPPASVARVARGMREATPAGLKETKASFNSRDPDGTRLIVAQTSRLAYSHNLQACDHNYLFSHSWSYLERDQLEDRSHRMGRIGPVSYTESVATKGRSGQTVDNEILDSITAKENFAERLSRDTTTMLQVV